MSPLLTAHILHAIRNPNNQIIQGKSTKVGIDTYSDNQFLVNHKGEQLMHLYTQSIDEDITRYALTIGDKKIFDIRKESGDNMHYYEMEVVCQFHTVQEYHNKWYKKEIVDPQEKFIVNFLQQKQR